MYRYIFFVCLICIYIVCMLVTYTIFFFLCCTFCMPSFYMWTSATHTSTTFVLILPFINHFFWHKHTHTQTQRKKFEKHTHMHTHKRKHKCACVHCLEAAHLAVELQMGCSHQSSQQDVWLSRCFHHGQVEAAATPCYPGCETSEEMEMCVSNELILQIMFVKY